MSGLVQELSAYLTSKGISLRIATAPAQLTALWYTHKPLVVAKAVVGKLGQWVGRKN